MAAGSSIDVEVVKLGGETVWSDAIPADLPCNELRRRVALALKVPWRYVQLAGEGPLEGSESLKQKGLVEGKQQIQLVLKDKSHEIRRIQAQIIEGMKDKKKDEVTLTEGLSDDEVEALEKRYGFCFPPEFLEFLQAGVLVGGGWHDWHALASGSIPPGFSEDSVANIIKWHCTPEDEEYYYERDWAPAEEKSLDKAIEFATKTYPVIPMYVHRCIVTVPQDECGLPVISMHQCSDNIPYGKNFWDWVAREFKLPEGTVPPEWTEASVPWDKVPFWQHWMD